MSEYQPFWLFPDISYIAFLLILYPSSESHNRGIIEPQFPSPEGTLRMDKSAFFVWSALSEGPLCLKYRASGRKPDAATRPLCLERSASLARKVAPVLFISLILCSVMPLAVLQAQHA